MTWYRVLTAEAQADRDNFDKWFTNCTCTCHLGAPPCGWCTHEGNPLNQEDDEFWEWVADGDPPGDDLTPFPEVLASTFPEE